MSSVLVLNAVIVCFGQYRGYDDDLNQVTNEPPRNDEDATVSLSDFDYYEDSSTTQSALTTIIPVPTTTTTTTTTTARPTTQRTTRRNSFRARNKFATNQLLYDSFNDASENSYVQKSKPVAAPLTRNTVYRAPENRKEDRSGSDNDGGNFSKRYARYLFAQRSG